MSMDYTQTMSYAIFDVLKVIGFHCGCFPLNIESFFGVTFLQNTTQRLLRYLQLFKSHFLN